MSVLDSGLSLEASSEKGDTVDKSLSEEVQKSTDKVMIIAIELSSLRC